MNNPNLYRFSSSPTPSIRYHLFQADVRSSPTSSYDNDQQYGGAGGPPSSGYHSPSASTLQYTNNNRHSAHYSFDRCDEDTSFVDPPYNTSSTSSSTSTSVDISPRSSFCPCRASLASGHAFVALAQHLQSTLDSLRHYNLHPPNSPCLLYRRIVELINLIQSVFLFLLYAITNSFRTELLVILPEGQILRIAARLTTLPPLPITPTFWLPTHLSTTRIPPHQVHRLRMNGKRWRVQVMVPISMFRRTTTNMDIIILSILIILIILIIIMAYSITSLLELFFVCFLNPLSWWYIELGPRHLV